MSSLDRAFIRAYAKEQPPAETHEAVSEKNTSTAAPMQYQSLRQPQLRYRIEPSHTPWGQATPPKPHVDLAPTSLPGDEETYPLASSECEAFTPSAWSAAPRVELPTYAVEPETPATPVVAPVTKTEPVAKKTTLGTIPPVPPEPVIAPVETKSPEAVPYDMGEIVCLPGMQAPESNYLATLFATAEVGAPALVMPIEPTAKCESPISVAATPETVCETEPVVAEPIVREVCVSPPAEVNEPAVAEQPVVAESVAAEETTIEPEAAPVVLEVAAAAPDEFEQAPIDDASAFWEVDQFLYPTITDRLVHEYSYFSQAGDKLKQAAAAGLKVLAITGLGREEGRSTLAICLARSAANAGLKVGLIDCDFERPTLAPNLGLDVATGWQNVAAGKMSLPEVAIRSIHDQITLLPLTQDATTAALQLGDARVADVIADATVALDVVILDLGPLNPALVAARKSVPFDAAIVVWDRRSKKLEEAQSAALLLSNAGVEAVGVAENFAREAKHTA